MIHECLILCYNANDAEKGLKADDFWVPFVFDMRDVVTVKGYVNSQNENEEDKAVLYFCGGAFIVNRPFKNMVEDFKKSRLTSFPLCTLSQH